MSDALSFEAFREHVAGKLELAPGTLAPRSSLADDLGFDSIRMMELLVAIEGLGVFLDEEVLVGMTTVDDAYRLYVAASTAASTSPS